MKDGEEVEIKISRSKVDGIVGLLKDVDLSSLELQHKARDTWARKSISRVS